WSRFRWAGWPISVWTPRNWPGCSRIPDSFGPGGQADSRGCHGHDPVGAQGCRRGIDCWGQSIPAVVPAAVALVSEQSDGEALVLHASIARSREGAQSVVESRDQSVGLEDFPERHAISGVDAVELPQPLHLRVAVAELAVGGEQVESHHR